MCRVSRFREERVEGSDSERGKRLRMSRMKSSIETLKQMNKIVHVLCEQSFLMAAVT